MKRIHLIKNVLVLAFICIVNVGYSQTTNIIPPTPNAMKMTEYYAQRPNMYTGTANVSIPLYSIDFDGMQLSLSISYNATGIRTNEEASEVGLGWSLNATGVISRTINNIDDLYPGTLSPPGYAYSQIVTYNLGYDPKTDSSEPSASSYYRQLSVGGKDTQPDLFNYNFFGYSGSFVLSQKLAVTPNIITVVKVTQDACSILFDEPGQTFTVVTPDGYKGEFTIKEKSTSFSTSPTSLEVSNNQGWGENYVDIQNEINRGRFRTITSWYLSKITSPNEEVINFSYYLNQDGSSPYLSNSHSYGEVEGITSDPVAFQTVHEHVYLKNILSQEVNIEFAMESREDIRINTFYTSVASGSYYPISLPLKRYSAIIVVGIDTASTLNKTITFSQKYFNQQYQDQGSGNQNENELLWLRSRLDRLLIDDQEYRFYYDNGANGLPKKLTFGVDHFGFYNGQDQNTMLLPPQATNHYGGSDVLADTANLIDTYRQRQERRVVFNYGRAGLLTKVRYPTRGYTLFTYEQHSYNPVLTGYFTEQSFSWAFNNANDGGGVRISSIKEYDYDDRLIKSRTYKYLEDPFSPQSASTGKLMTPLYNRYAQLFVSGFNFLYKTYSTIAGNSSAEGKVIGYSKVHEIVNGLNENYRSTYYFENRPNKILEFNSIAVGYPTLNGQSLEVRDYNSQGNIVQWTVNQDTYHPIDSIKAIIYEQIPASPWLRYYAFYTIKRTFNTPHTVVTYTGDSQNGFSDANVTSGTVTSSGKAIQTTKTFTYNDDFLIKTQLEHTSDGDTIVAEYKRPSDFAYSSASSTLKHMRRADVNMVNPVIEELVTRNGVTVSANGNKYFYDSLGSQKVNLLATYSFNRALGDFAASPDGDAFPSPYEIKASFTRYDLESGKLLEYTSRDGIIHSFIWGYNNKLPIVHGTGISYNQLSQAYTASQGSNYETAIRDHSNTAGKQVSTYEYNPQIGISKVTDPAGISKSFDYNAFGRLNTVRDDDSYITNQNKYHFKTLPVSRTMELSATSINFGTFYDCNLPGTRVLTISNSGEDDLTVNYLSWPSGFNSSWAGGVIAAGTSVDAIVSFTGSPGTYSGSISINSDLTSGTSTIPVNAVYSSSGTQKTIQLSVNSMTFPIQFQQKTVTVTNAGDDCMSVTGVSYPSTPNWSASVTPATLAPGQSTQMTILRTGSSAEALNISVVSDKNDGNEVIHVTQ